MGSSSRGGKEQNMKPGTTNHWNSLWMEKERNVKQPTKQLV
jgi:hypothetical protein